MTRTPVYASSVNNEPMTLPPEAKTRKRSKPESSPLPKWLDGVDRERWAIGEEKLANATPTETLVELLAHHDTTTEGYYMSSSDGVKFKCPATNLLVAAWRAMRIERVPALTLEHHAALQRQIADLKAELETVSEALPPEAKRGY